MNPTDDPIHEQRLVLMRLAKIAGWGRRRFLEWIWAQFSVSTVEEMDSAQIEAAAACLRALATEQQGDAR